MSAASVWEVAIKHRSGKLPVDPVSFRDECLGAGAIIQVEIASGDRASLQAAVDRLVRLIQADLNKAQPARVCQALALYPT
ncbi:MAG: hypothetical protein K9L32_09340 [Chromatiaceae bacterium]|nr:hypothetical protein [Chromatiaceae bacterium]